MAISMACSKSAFLWATVFVSYSFLVVTPFQIDLGSSHCHSVQLPLNEVSSQTHLSATLSDDATESSDDVDTVTPPLTAAAIETPSTKIQITINETATMKTPTDEILDQALRSNSTAAQILLDKIGELRNKATDGNGEEEMESYLNHLLSLADGQMFATTPAAENNDNSLPWPWWTRLRILTRVSRRARRASLHRVLTLSTPSPDDGETDTLESPLRLRRRALLLVLRSLAASDGTPVRSVERDARRGARSAATYRDMASRVPPGLETPGYVTVVRRRGYDVREYDSFAVCSVRVAQPRPVDRSATDAPLANPKMRGASSFGALAGYLFGKNDVGVGMKMTTPVLMEGEGEGREMSFVLPSEYWGERGLEEAPKPLEGSLVSLRREGGGGKAVRMFGGFASKEDVRVEVEELRSALQGDKEWVVKEDAVVTLAQYNDPFTPPWKRRNEVSLPVVTRKN